MSYFRENIDLMQGYTPGEQPRNSKVIKLNTNENPYPPSIEVMKALSFADIDSLRVYPNPTSDELRKTVAQIYELTMDNILIGNGSDDILTIIIRSFVPETGTIAYFEPSYSLYKTLAEIQGSKVLSIPLNEDFTYPTNLPDIVHAQILFVTRPNAPTSNSCDKQWLKKVIKDFSGIVVIDEAYSEFADDDCIDLISEFDNVIVTRTLSKSYSLAGLRVGYALTSKKLILGMMKVRDSYNVNHLSQMAAIAALQDQDYFNDCISKIKTNRQKLKNILEELNFKVINSQTNFLFVKPPESIQAEILFQKLKKEQVFVRYFAQPSINSYLRITIGTKEENEKLIKLITRLIL